MPKHDQIPLLAIASPCPASWDAMTGDDRVRHCSTCDRPVYNLAAMKPGEVAGLIESTGGHLCGRLYRRKDGTALASDCPVGVRLSRGRRLRRLAIAGMLATLAAPVALAVSPAPLAERWRRIRNVPGGPSVTLADWKDYALTVAGYPPRRQMILGKICIMPPATPAVAPLSPVPPPSGEEF